MSLNRTVISFLFCLVILISGCWYSDAPQIESFEYLSSHSDMSDREIRDFVWDGDVEIERLVQLAKSKSVQVRRLAAQNEKLPAEYLEKMMEDKSWKVVVASSHNPNFTQEMFDKLTAHKNVKVRQYLSSFNKRIPVKNLVTLSKDKVNEVRASAARHPELPEEDIRRLAKDKFAGVRLSIAANENVPSDVLVKLSKDDDLLVVIEAAKNAKLSEEDFRRVYAIKTKASLHRSICSSLVKNPNTPMDILIKIYTKSDRGYIRNAAEQHPNMRQYFQAIRKSL